MSQIIKQLREKRRMTGNSYPWITPLSATPMDVEEKITCREIAFSEMNEYEMSFKVMTVFKCRYFEKDRAFANAEKMLLQTIHKDMLGKIALLRAAIYGCDVEGAMNLLGEMEKEMGL